MAGAARGMAMRGEDGSWAVVATVQEPAPLVAAFAAHWLALGAEEVHLFLDGPSPEVEAALTGRPGVRLVVCDAAFWATRRREGRPALVTGRQRFNANAVLREGRQAWLVHCDADEFLVPEAAIAGQLAMLGPGVDFARIGVKERLWLRHSAPQTIFDGVFRGPDPRDGTRREGLDPALRPCLNPHGMLGHAAGKSVVRRGAAVRMGIHFPEPQGPKLPPQALEAWRAERGGTIAGWLAHFDGLTPLHWVVKQLRKFAEHERLHEGSGPLDLGPRTEDRKAQMRLVHGLRRDPAALRGLMEALMTVEAPGGAVVPGPGGLADVARRRFPDLALDFSVAGFDGHLRAAHAELLAGMELAL